VKILVDTNIVLDALLARKPHVHAASQLIASIVNDKYVAYLCATTLTTIHILATKSAGTREADRIIKELLKLFEIAPVNRNVIETAMALNFNDFEDAVLFAAAHAVDVQAIISRKKQGFKKVSIPVYTADEFISMHYLR